MLASGFYHDDLRMMPSFHVLGLGDPLRSNGFRMMQNLVADFVFVETINESFRYFHDQPPMQIITFQGDLYFPDPAWDLTGEWTRNGAGRNASIIGHRREDCGTRNIVKYGYMRSLRK